MTEHKILGLIESMAQNGQVMTEQKYKEIADLLGKKVNEHKPTYRITFFRAETHVIRLDDELLVLENKLRAHQQVLEMPKTQYENIQCSIRCNGYHTLRESFLENKSNNFVDIEFASADEEAATVRVLNPEIVVVQIARI